MTTDRKCCCKGCDNRVTPPDEACASCCALLDRLLTERCAERGIDPDVLRANLNAYCDDAAKKRTATGPHLIDGEFQSDKYPTCPRGKVPLSVKDPTAQDLLWQYAQRRRVVDAEFAGDLEAALAIAGYTRPTAPERAPLDLDVAAVAYSVVDEIDEAWGSLLRGPDDFECRLGEPEDCNWLRDGAEAVKRLNAQHRDLAARDARIAALESALTEEAEVLLTFADHASELFVKAMRVIGKCAPDATPPSAVADAMRDRSAELRAVLAAAIPADAPVPAAPEGSNP